MPHAIEVRHVSKRFKRVHDPSFSIKDRILRGGRIPFDWFQALDDIDLTVAEGETVGMLGHNGSGKSTLLKIIAGIIRPTTGDVLLRGRLASLLELGAGFHPDLSGRENVFINASFLGIPRKDIEARFDEIVAFAELEPFIDTQVKYYSSGMYVRLGFAVAVNVDPDVLLVDEVLAVGDEVFQKKCLDRVAQFQREGRTILFVTHGADLVRQICTRAIVLDHGKMVANGAPGESIRIFREHLHGVLANDHGDEATPERDPRIAITGVHLSHPAQPQRRFLYAGEPLSVIVGYRAKEPMPGVVVRFEIYDGRGQVVWGATTDTLGAPLPTLHGEGEIVLDLAAVPLLDGAYPVRVTLEDRAAGTPLDWRDPEQQAFEVVNPTKVVGSVALPASVNLREGAPLR
jgi:ABC-2 type transport system ATP-binding protein